MGIPDVHLARGREANLAFHRNRAPAVILCAGPAVVFAGIGLAVALFTGGCARESLSSVADQGRVLLAAQLPRPAKAPSRRAREARRGAPDSALLGFRVAVSVKRESPLHQLFAKAGGDTETKAECPA